MLRNSLSKNGYSGNGYTDRQRMLRESYGNAFLEPDPSRKLGDGMMWQVSSVFSENDPPSGSASDATHAHRVLLWLPGPPDPHP